MKRFALCLLTFQWIAGVCPAAEPPPDLDPRLGYSQSGVKMTLVAEHPSVVTPTGIDVDGSGDLWVVSSHTHFRPDDYDGPEHDEVVVLGDGTRSVFYDKSDATMDLELAADFEESGWVYLAERDRIFRVRDSDGDGRGDQEELIANLETEADYPHNGLSGLAWHPSGDLIFALGENYWRPWTLTGRDGSTVSGSGEGGVFRCAADGKSLRRIAKGFWNPFGICVREDGTLFAAENDPGARPPCRLLQIVEGGDYGYQRSYGNAPFHPFVCWDGQLRGTLPMLHSLGEAPCGIAPLANGLIVPSWTDHRIDFYPLAASGASFTTRRVTLVTGEHHFRPTCITQHSATVFYLTDWVFGSYALHQRGRVWRLEIDPEKTDWLGASQLAAAHQDAKLANQLRSGGKVYDNQQLLDWARSDDPFIARAALDALSSRVSSYDEGEAAKLSCQDQISLLLAIRKWDPSHESWVRFFLKQEDQEIRFETLRWIADERLQAFLPDVEDILGRSDTEYRVFEACLATLNTLSGNPRLGIADAEMLINRVADDQASASARAFALRLLEPTHKRFSKGLWQQLYDTGDQRLISELARALAANGTESAKPFLIRLASDETIPMQTRADAVSGLAGSQQTLGTLIDFAAHGNRSLREEALRAIRFCDLDQRDLEQLETVSRSFPESADLVQAAIDPDAVKRGRPDARDLEAWQKRLAEVQQPVDIAAGRRIFHHRRVGTCVHCHRHSGRGSAVGPDLSAASNIGDSNRLLRALLQPSRDVDPQYFPRALVTEDGKVFTGIMLRDGGGGKEYYRDASGRERMFLTDEIVERKELNTSMMPEGLIDLMTDREIRDLLAFLDASTRASNESTTPGHN